ncbi:MAG TPA: GNAT family N-acetyltransferase [Pyrinomonadaceae bacterium]|jgi:GNAT superfamily N-acetyltransferase
MRVRSMQFLTNMIFWRRNGNVHDRGDYLLVETPSNPGYYWGNLLIFGRPPAEGDHLRWMRLFEREFKHRPEVRHVLFGWESDDGDGEGLRPFFESGFELEMNVTLLAERVHPPPKVNEEIEVRRIETEAEWEAVLDNQVRCRRARFDLDAYTNFKRSAIENWRKLIGDGLGDWYGAFLGDRLVADLGLFREGDIARFQAVGTDPDFRRRGICGTLVHCVSRHALERLHVKTLVMVADENYHAAKIYESVGFDPRERVAFLCRYPK